MKMNIQKLYAQGKAWRPQYRHVDVEYSIITIIIIEKEVNNLVRKIVKRQPTKKRPNEFRNAKDKVY